MLNGVRIVTGLAVVGFVLRYVLVERRLRREREALIERETLARLGPWRQWERWRNEIIAQEFANERT